MLITYADSHRWTKPVALDALDDFGKNSKARLRSTLSNIDQYAITNIIAPLDESFLDWFLPLYVTRINEKTNPRVFDIAAKTLGSKHPERYYSMTLYENGIPLGGTIFSLRKNRLSIAYRTYSNDWLTAKLQANPSSYTEYLICKYAREINKEIIIHGKDRNPYGLNSSIGLANFKLSYGCQPELPKKFETHTLDTDTLQTDALIFEYPTTADQKITKGYLVVSPESKDKWIQVTKYPTLVAVETILRA